MSSAPSPVDRQSSRGAASAVIGAPKGPSSVRRAKSGQPPSAAARAWTEVHVEVLPQPTEIVKAPKVGKESLPLAGNKATLPGGAQPFSQFMDAHGNLWGTVLLAQGAGDVQQPSVGGAHTDVPSAPVGSRTPVSPRSLALPFPARLPDTGGVGTNHHKTVVRQMCPWPPQHSQDLSPPIVPPQSQTSRSLTPVVRTRTPAQAQRTVLRPPSAVVESRPPTPPVPLPCTPTATMLISTHHVSSRSSSRALTPPPSCLSNFGNGVARTTSVWQQPTPAFTSWAVVSNGSTT